MKKTKIILLILLVWAWPAGVNGMENMFRNGVLHFDYKQLEKDLAALVAIPAQERTFDNTILGYERAFDRYGEALGMSGFLSYVSTDKAFRDAALELQMQISQYMVDVATRRDIYPCHPGIYRRQTPPARGRGQTG